MKSKLYHSVIIVKNATFQAVAWIHALCLIVTPFKGYVDLTQAYKFDFI